MHFNFKKDIRYRAYEIKRLSENAQFTSVFLYGEILSKLFSRKLIFSQRTTINILLSTHLLSVFLSSTYCITS